MSLLSGEMVEWWGWSLISGTQAGLWFAVFTSGKSTHIPHTHSPLVSQNSQKNCNVWKIFRLVILIFNTLLHSETRFSGWQGSIIGMHRPPPDTDFAWYRPIRKPDIRCGRFIIFFTWIKSTFLVFPLNYVVLQNKHGHNSFFLKPSYRFVVGRISACFDNRISGLPYPVSGQILDIKRPGYPAGYLEHH